MKPLHPGFSFPGETFMKLRLISLALFYTLVLGAAFAHGSKVHLRGTVEKINTDSLVVRTADGKSVKVRFDGSTVFLSRSNNEDKPAKAGDLATGDLVVIHATLKDNALEADEVKFSAPAAAKPVVPTPAKPKP
jgi:hypothetical protein